VCDGQIKIAMNRYFKFSTLLTVVSLLIVSTMMSQDVIDYSISAIPKKTKTTYSDVRYTITDGNDSYLFAGKAVYMKGNVDIYHLSTDLALINESTIKLKVGGSKLVYSSSFIIENTIYILGFDPTSGAQLDVYCQLVDKNTLTLIGEPMRIGASRYKSQSAYYPESLFMVKSDDNSKILVGFSSLNEDGTNEVLELHCFDKELNKIYSKTMKGELSNGDKKLWTNTGFLAWTVSSLPKMLDNNGNFRIGMKKLNGIGVFEAPNESTEWVSYSINIDSRDLASVFFENTGSSDFFISGGLNSPMKNGNISVFRAKVNRDTKKVEQSSFANLSVIESIEELKIGGNDGAASPLSDSEGIYDVIWKGVHYNSDGSGVFYGEKIDSPFRTRTTTKQSRISTTTSTHTYQINNYYDILVVGFDTKNEIIWNRIIPRKQEVPMRDIEGSHFFFDEDGSTYVVYNENSKNLDNKPDKEIRNLGLFGNEVAIVKIDRDGKAMRQPLQGDIKDLRGTIFPSLCISTEVGKTTLFFKQKNDSFLVPITFKE